MTHAPRRFPRVTRAQELILVWGILIPVYLICAWLLIGWAALKVAEWIA